MSVKLKIGFNSNFITNNSYTKFLGVTMNNTLSWNNHIDLLMKKLSKACYIIRNAKIYKSVSSLKVIYYTFFFIWLSYEIIFWGNSSHSSTIKKKREREREQLELWKDVGESFM